MGGAQNIPSNPEEELANESPLRLSLHFYVKARRHEKNLIIAYIEMLSPEVFPDSSH